MKFKLAAIFAAAFSVLITTAIRAQTTQSAPATQPAARQLPDRPIPQIEHVVIVSIDGLRPDLALRANTPNLHALLDASSFTFWAKTTALSITLPSHTTMLTGVSPRAHGIEWNADLPLTHPIYPNYPTLFELAHKAGYTTAMVAGKSKFNTLAKPGTLDWAAVADHSTSSNDSVLAEALSILKEHQPEVLFVHFPAVDNAGHAKGWASPEQMAAIANSDKCVGQLLAALDELKIHDRTFFLVTADHGGAGRNHGPEDPRSRHIPWIASGPGIRKGLDLTTFSDLTVNTEDTFATACYLLGIKPERKVEGRAVVEIVQRDELLQAR